MARRQLQLITREHEVGLHADSSGCDESDRDELLVPAHANMDG